MGDRLAAIDMGPFGGELGPHLTQCGLGRALPLHQLASSPSSRLATTDRPKSGGAVPLFRGAGSPSNPMSSGLSHFSTPSGIFIHSAVCPQQTWAKNWGTGSPSNAMSPGPRPISISSGILIHPAVWPQQTRAQNCGAVPLLGRGSWVPI